MTKVNQQELIERLLHDEVKQGPSADPLCQEAAEALQSQQAEIERLREGLEELLTATQAQHSAQPRIFIGEAQAKARTLLGDSQP